MTGVTKVSLVRCDLGALGQEAFEGASRDVDTAESKMSESV